MSTARQDQALKLHVGTYARNGGRGLYPLMRSVDGQWSLGDAWPDAHNASFAAYSARHDLHYLVDEENAALGAFRCGDGGWRRLGSVPTQGRAPCYLALDAAEERLVVANYESGSIAVFRLDVRTGLPLAPADVRLNAGSGTVPGRQDGPHAHCVCFSPDQRWIYHVDLGTDQILAYPFDPATNLLGEMRIAFTAPAGSGPRHLVFHKTQQRALLVSELASTLTILDLGDGHMTARQRISTLPADCAAQSLGGHISLNAAGDRVYVTNRGHDSIAVFAWNASGALDLLQHLPSEGASPRAFVLLEAQRQLVLANEESGSVAIFDIVGDGTLAPPHAQIAVQGAAFLFVEGAESRLRVRPSPLRHPLSPIDHPA